MADFGIGETLLADVATGALVGGGISALTGGNFLTGALTGGIGGGIKSFMPNFTDIFKGTPAVGADVGTSGLTSAGAQAYIPPTAGSSIATSPFGTSELVSATSPFGTAGTSGITNVAANAFPNVSPDVIQAAQLQSEANAGNISGSTGDASQNIASPKTDYAKLIQENNLKPVGLTNQIDGPLANGNYALNGKIDRGAQVANLGGPQSLLQKYQTPLLGLGAFGAYKMATAKPTSTPIPVPATGALTGKYNLASNYQSLGNPTPVYPRFAEGGIASLASGGNMMSDKVNVDFMHGDMYPMSQQNRSFYATPSQMPTSAQQTMASYEPKTNPLTGEATANMASGGISDLGAYSDGGRMLQGPGDGMSDSIPGMIANKRPARLAEGEFVVPADVVSHLGNGSTDAGAKQLYAMMNKVRQARTGSKKQGKQINPRQFMPA